MGDSLQQPDDSLHQPDDSLHQNADSLHQNDDSLHQLAVGSSSRQQAATAESSDGASICDNLRQSDDSLHQPVTLCASMYECM